MVERLNFRPELAADAEITGIPESNRGMLGMEKPFFNLTPDAFSREVVEIDLTTDGNSGRIDDKFKPRRELHRAEDAQAIFDKGCRIDDPDKSLVEIGPAIKWIDQLRGKWIIKDGVDGKVPSAGSFGEGHIRVTGDDKATVSAADLRLAPWEADIDGE